MTTAYQIGHYYRVPCMWVPDVESWLPILGPWHEDKDVIGFTEPHYHVDWRLVGPSLYEYFKERHAAVHAKVFSRQDLGTDSPRLETKRLRCWREMPEFPSHHPLDRTEAVPWMPALEREHADCRLKCGKVCPHRGISLEGMPVKDGVVVCPGHGLAWNVETGAMVRRTTDADAIKQCMCPSCSRWVRVGNDGLMAYHYTQNVQACPSSHKPAPQKKVTV